MRDAFIEELTKLARKDKSIFLIIGDLGYGVIDQFAEEFPERFLNAGIAEQSMMSLAAGIAATGYKVFVYSIANFPTFRCLEQIRNDVCYHNRDVTVVSIGAGLGYGTLGYTHHAIEDIAIMRALPNIEILSPYDPNSTKKLVQSAVLSSGPKYLRLGKNGESEIQNYFDQINADYSITEKPSTDEVDIMLVSTGAITENALMAGQILKDDGVVLQNLAITSIKPLNSEILQVISKAKRVAFIEEHSVVGGLSSSILEACALSSLPIQPLLLGLNEDSVGMFNGSQNYLRAQNGLDAPGIAKAIKKYFKI